MEVTYSEDRKTAFFDGYKFRRDSRTGYYLSTRKTTSGKRERLHCYVWRYFNGQIKEGYHVHHKDEDRGNNRVENLICTRGKTHSSYHLLKYSTNHPDRMAENLSKNARPKASAWHGSVAGREWHSTQGKRTAARMKEKEFICENCGKPFWKKPFGKNLFCSNKCKAAYRRRMGLDDETRRCGCCGKEFRANKYANKRYCSKECRDSVRRAAISQTGGQTAGL